MPKVISLENHGRDTHNRPFDLSGPLKEVWYQLITYDEHQDYKPLRV